MGELEAVLDSQELTEWRGFYRLEPFGARREEYRAGEVAAAVLNAGGVKRRGSRRPWRAEHVFQSLRPNEREEVDQVAAGMRAWVLLTKGKGKPRRGGSA